MKQELRCHAVLCPSEKKARLMATRLQERLHQALVDFRKEKMSRQNARLSLANSIYENPTMPCRKILLHTGSSNYRPSPDRAKSAPKLKVSALPPAAAAAAPVTCIGCPIRFSGRVQSLSALYRCIFLLRDGLLFWLSPSQPLSLSLEAGEPIACPKNGENRHLERPHL